jgi:hypothetical protein
VAGRRGARQRSEGREVVQPEYGEIERGGREKSQDQIPAGLVQQSAHRYEIDLAQLAPAEPGQRGEQEPGPETPQPPQQGDGETRPLGRQAGVFGGGAR